MSLLRPHPRCCSRTPQGRRCRRRVPAWGQRCDSCWGQLVSSPSIAIRLQLAREIPLPAHIRARLVQDQAMAVRAAMASRPDLTVAEQQQLIRDEHVPVLRDLALNPSLSPDLRVQLAAHPDILVRTRAMVQLTANP
jgi:hypothetical protein